MHKLNLLSLALERRWFRVWDREKNLRLENSAWDSVWMLIFLHALRERRISSMRGLFIQCWTREKAALKSRLMFHNEFGINFVSTSSPQAKKLYFLYFLLKSIYYFQDTGFLKTKLKRNYRDLRRKKVERR